MIIQADILDWCKRYDGPPFHALLCDPPYHLTDPRDPRRGYPARTDDVWDDEGRVRAQGGRGFMNARWDGGDIAFRPETWAALAAHLHPGAFGMAFAGTRGYHRMACAIEDAGLIIHPAIGWAFGSGFPKATRIDTQIDKAAGAERTEVAWKPIAYPDSDTWGTPNKNDDGTVHNPSSYHRKGNISNGMRPHSVPATDLAAAWQGHRYGLQALKPSFEFIAVFQKPYQGRPVDCITRTGAGAINVDGGRIATSEDCARTPVPVEGIAKFGYSPAMGGQGHEGGRWPANLVLQHVYLPVLRLRDIISPEAAQIIWRYFDGYNRVQAVRQGVRGLAESREVWKGEVLQPTMQRPLPNDIDRREKPAQGEISHRASDSEDSKGGPQAGAGVHRREAPPVEGRELHEPRLPLCVDQHAECRGSGDCMADGSEGECLHHRTSPSNGAQPRASSGKTRECSSHQRQQDGQQDRKSGTDGSVGTFADASRSSEGDRETEATDRGTRGRERILEVFADDIPPGWFQYFEVTGEDLGCNGTCVDGCAVKALGEQSGEGASSNHIRHNNARQAEAVFFGQADTIDRQTSGHNDIGTAARYFFNADYALDRLEAADAVRYVAKAGTGEREAGLDDLPMQTRNRVNPGGLEHDPKWAPVQRKNTHPTCKPISLARWLATLLLPPGLYAPRRLIIPFAGVGSEMIGADLAGWEEITGIELEADHVTIAQARLAWWRTAARRLHTSDPAAILELQELAAQASLFDA